MTKRFRERGFYSWILSRLGRWALALSFGAFVLSQLYLFFERNGGFATMGAPQRFLLLATLSGVVVIVFVMKVGQVRAIGRVRRMSTHSPSIIRVVAADNDLRSRLRSIGVRYVPGIYPIVEFGDLGLVFRSVTLDENDDVLLNWAELSNLGVRDIRVNNLEHRGVSVSYRGTAINLAVFGRPGFIGFRRQTEADFDHLYRVVAAHLAAAQK